MIPKQLENKTYHFGDIPVIPLDIQHGKLIINGFRFNDCAYITDCSGIPDETRVKLNGLKVLVLNSLGFKPHSTHFNLSQALEAAKVNTAIWDAEEAAWAGLWAAAECLVELQRI